MKQTAQGPSWSYFKRLFTHLEWLDELGDTAVWVEGVAAPKIDRIQAESAVAEQSGITAWIFLAGCGVMAPREVVRPPGAAPPRRPSPRERGRGP